jgi:type IV pilus assembly protein PilF
VTRYARLRIVAVVFAAAGWMLVSCSAPTADMKKEAAARMEMGVTYLEQRNLPAAMRELTKAKELDPENPQIDMTLGLAYQKRGDLEKAEEYLRVAVRKKPDYAEAHNNLGNLLSLRGKREEAIREYEKAVAIVTYPTPEYAYYNMGREYALLKDLPKAEAMYQHAIVLRPSFVEAYQELAMVQSEEGKWEESVRTLEKMVKIAPYYARGWMDLGRFYLRMKQPGKAGEAFRSALSNTDDPALRSEIAGYLNVLEQGKR